MKLSRGKKHTETLQKHSGKTMALAVTFLQHIKEGRTKVQLVRHVKNGVIVLLFPTHTHPNRNEPLSKQHQAADTLWMSQLMCLCHGRQERKVLYRIA